MADIPSIEQKLNTDICLTQPDNTEIWLNEYYVFLNELITCYLKKMQKNYNDLFDYIVCQEKTPIKIYLKYFYSNDN